MRAILAFNGLKDYTCCLTLPAPCISASCIKTKINWSFYFHTSLWYLKRFYEGLHKTFWGTTKKCENKNFKVNFFSWSGIGMGWVVCETLQWTPGGKGLIFEASSMFSLSIVIFFFRYEGYLLLSKKIAWNFSDLTFILLHYLLNQLT